ncbi:hypothetical protein [Mycolicibacterium litorale]|uniref:MalT-like TPR region domain-containing protein n=1 Tax=Mycolicibacterium litorale TaxID=758802 RepID=A0AAD1ILB2_9MYCO|nr:hypothetical protein [Mycolicibacterium litorale]MCV7416223.1 hypothetical protein [Mycolicibacterium litorale]TDY09473.1 hypothetical protein BCL50_1566 [Mycolicibacterium litorale]BBY17420.1 hypothetical protein MLIT_30120 [Mycolicibacterium litorale]
MTSTHASLIDAAFGERPDMWPLPAATDPQDRWLRAVAAGGQGRYAVALAELAALHRSAGTGLQSSAMSTRASFLRQLGGHHDAAGWDGRALAAAGADAAATADALIGLAADALGVGRFGASQRLLDRAVGPVDAADDARLPIRLDWVSAELAMMRGDGATAVAHAERAVAAAASIPSARHRLKSDVVLAAALCSRGEVDRSRAIADAALDRAGDLGLVPLRWALASLLADIGSSEYTPGQVTDFRDASADTVRRRGGVWSDR